MPGHIDEIFSPERLDRNWVSGVKKTNEKSTTTPQIINQEVLCVVRRLETLINERFSPEQISVLSVVMGELNKLINKRFPKSESDALLGDEEADIDKSIIELLNNLESLLEAFGL